MARDATLNVNVTGLPVFKDAVAAIVALHQPTDEEVEFWADDETHAEHDRRFPECPSLNNTGDCEGHEATIQVCDECGYMHDGDYPRYRHWPCPTIQALEPLGVRAEEVAQRDPASDEGTP